MRALGITTGKPTMRSTTEMLLKDKAIDEIFTALNTDPESIGVLLMHQKRN